MIFKFFQIMLLTEKAKQNKQNQYYLIEEMSSVSEGALVPSVWDIRKDSLPKSQAMKKRTMCVHAHMTHIAYMCCVCIICTDLSIYTST